MNKGKRARIKKKVKMTKCKYCRSTENLTIDHKVPKIQGGSDNTENLQCLCKRCNGIKSGLSHKQVMRLFDWFAFIEDSRAKHNYKTYSLKREIRLQKTSLKLSPPQTEE